MAEINKTRRTIGWVLSGLICVALTISAFRKFFGTEGVTEAMTKVNLEEKLLVIGIVELLCVIAYLIPKTSNVGFFLCSSYLGGAIAIEMAMGEFPLVGIAFNTILWIGTYLRKPEVFGLGLK